MAVHLFIFYWGMVSFITPPVALGAFAAATIARANPFQVGLVSMRLGAVIYVVPFFFVLNPALILKGTPFEIAEAVTTTLVGLLLICAALQGYLIGVGRIAHGLVGVALRLALAFAGFCIALPSDEIFGLTHGHAQLVAVGAAVASISALLIRRMEARQPAIRAT
jgi:TRAP-type uncharacterized transport system fused permease subunit